jgi:hypothetical protein
VSAPLLGREQILAVLRDLDVASPRYLLTMKLLAARDEDVDDILFLYRQCGFRTVEEGLDLVEAAYPGRTIPVRLQYLLEEHIADGPDRGPRS